MTSTGDGDGPDVRAYLIFFFLKAAVLIVALVRMNCINSCCVECRPGDTALLHQTHSSTKNESYFPVVIKRANLATQRALDLMHFFTGNLIKCKKKKVIEQHSAKC